MKKLFLVVAAGFAGFWLANDSIADCQTLNFPNNESICFDIKKNNTDTFQAITSSSRISDINALSCQLSLPNGDTVKLPRCEGRFNYAGSDMKIELRADLENSYYILISNYDFKNGRFYDGSSSNSNTNYQNHQVEFSNINSNSPRTYDRIDLTLGVRNNGYSYYNNSFAGTVDITVEEYRNGRWQSASSQDYYLERSSINFYSSDNGTRRLERFAYFKTTGEFRLVAKISGTDYSAYQAFYINTHGNNSNSRYENYTTRASDTSLSFSSMSDNRPLSNQWIDIELRLYDAYYSRNRVDFSVEEYRNGSWRSAHSSDYSLDRNSYTFSSEERVKFNSFLKFHTSGEFRLVASLENGRVARQTFYVNARWSNSSSTNFNTNLNYSNAEFNKLKAVYDIWHGIIDSLKKDYPRLRNNSTWIQNSNTFYNNMREAINGTRYPTFNSWSIFYKHFQDWLSLTLATR